MSSSVYREVDHKTPLALKCMCHATFVIQLLCRPLEWRAKDADAISADWLSI